MDDQNKNLLLATVLSFLVILTWFILFPPEEQAPGTTDDQPLVAETPADALPDADAAGGTTPGGDPSVAEVPDAPRLPVETPSLTGSISLQGGRIDDLSLKGYRETIDPDSDLVRLFSPVGEPRAYYALYGWAPGGGISPDQVPGPNTVWQIEEGETLTPDSPVTLVWDNGAGQIFRRTISIDEDFLFSISQSVENYGESDIALAPYGLVRRHGEPDSVNFFILHEGVVRMSDGKLEEIDYSDLPNLEAAEGQIEVASDGWTGFTDKYWMSALVPASGSEFRSVARYADDIYQIETVFPTLSVPAGQTVSAEAQLFAGAKEWEVIRRYQNEEGIDGFVDSIDWGWFFFLTKPIFALLHFLNQLIGNMGWAIIVLTLVLKALVLPLAYKSYVSMARMKELQPEMEKLKEQAGDDRQKMQQGMMELYKKNKVNPASGCLPILIQIPIFFALYKVIFVTIELRHAPWALWIRDLSAPDPSSILNLFGLLPYSTPEQGSIFFIFSLGVLPIFLGISMWLQQKLNPAPADPTQQMIFAWMPWIFMFMLGSFASGLVLYWIANNVITFLQQYAIMRSHGHKPDVFGNIRRSFQRKPKVAAEAAGANANAPPGGKPRGK